jgi:hypothetical protein
VGVLATPFLISVSLAAQEINSIGDLRLIDGKWYVSNSGLLRIARRKHCHGMQIEALKEFCDFDASRFAFRATIFTSPTCKGFVGYGEAHPSNVSSAVHRAEMRVAETRAVNRALRKAYGIGICSVEEIGSFAEPQVFRESKKLPPQPANGNPSERPLNGTTQWSDSNALRRLGETRMTGTPTKIRAILERISDALSQTESDLRSYSKEHPDFKEVGDRILREWEKGRQLSLQAR